MIFFVDTNIFLRTAVKETLESFEECLAFLKLVKTNKIKAITSSFVIAEFVWTLSSYYKQDKKTVTTLTDAILNLRGLAVIENHNYKIALDNYKNHKVKFIDCLIASIDKIKDKKATIVSYDKDFDKLGVLRQTPSQVAKTFLSVK